MSDHSNNYHAVEHVKRIIYQNTEIEDDVKEILIDTVDDLLKCTERTYISFVELKNFIEDYKKKLKILGTEDNLVFLGFVKVYKKLIKDIGMPKEFEIK